MVYRDESHAGDYVRSAEAVNWRRAKKDWFHLSGYNVPCKKPMRGE
jgi:hypothetical protein